MTDVRQDYAAGWKPAPGDSTAGIVQSIDTVKGKFGDYLVYGIIRDDNGEGLALHAYHTVFKNEMENAVIGSHVQATYNGRAETKDGRPYHSYGCIVTAPEASA